MSSKYSEGQRVKVSEHVRTRDIDILALTEGGATGEILEVIDEKETLKTSYLIEFDEGVECKIYEETIIGVEE